MASKPIITRRGSTHSGPVHAGLCDYPSGCVRYMANTSWRMRYEPTGQGLRLARRELWYRGSWVGGAPFGSMSVDVAEQRSIESIAKGLELGISYYDTAPAVWRWQKRAILREWAVGR